MRIGVEIDLGRVRLDEAAARAAEVEEQGLDLVWFTPPADRPEQAVVAAAACAATTRWLHVGIRAGSGAHHPLYLAEELHVLDQLLAGRLIAAVADVDDDPARLAETVTVLLSGGAPRPFRHEGARWTIPANLADNTVNPEVRLRVTPQPYQLGGGVWLDGLAGAPSASRFGLPFVAGAEDTTATVARAWQRVDVLLGDASLRLRRPAIRAWTAAGDGAAGVAALVGALTVERDAWGLDTAVVRLPEVCGDPWRDALRALARHVRPRLQLDRLPSGLEQFWTDRYEHPADGLVEAER